MSEDKGKPSPPKPDKDLKGRINQSAEKEDE